MVLGAVGGGLMAIGMGVVVSISVSQILELKITAERVGAFHLALGLFAGAARAGLGEGRDGGRGQAAVGSKFFLVKGAKAVDGEKVFFVAQGNLLSLVPVVGNLGVGKVHKAELVLGIKLGGE